MKPHILLALTLTAPYGSTTVEAGSLVLGASDRLADVSTLVVSGGTLNLATFADTVAGVQQTGGSIANGTLTSSSRFEMQAGDVSAVLAGTQGLRKTTAGTLTLALGPEGRARYPLTHFDRDIFLSHPSPEMPEMPGMARFTLGPDGTAVSITIDSLDANGLGTLTRVD